MDITILVLNVCLGDKKVNFEEVNVHIYCAIYNIIIINYDKKVVTFSANKNITRLHTLFLFKEKG